MEIVDLSDDLNQGDTRNQQKDGHSMRRFFAIAPIFHAIYAEQGHSSTDDQCDAPPVVDPDRDAPVEDRLDVLADDLRVARVVVAEGRVVLAEGEDAVLLRPSEKEAAGKWRRVQLSSVQLTSYYSGFSQIYDYRERLQKEQGGRFDLKRFHERFLSYGSAPVRIIEQMMAAAP